MRVTELLQTMLIFTYDCRCVTPMREFYGVGDLNPGNDHPLVRSRSIVQLTKRRHVAPMNHLWRTIFMVRTVRIRKHTHALGTTVWPRGGIELA